MKLILYFVVWRNEIVLSAFILRLAYLFDISLLIDKICIFKEEGIFQINMAAMQIANELKEVSNFMKKACSQLICEQAHMNIYSATINSKST